jgi:hypothetical protein
MMLTTIAEKIGPYKACRSLVTVPPRLEDCGDACGDRDGDPDPFNIPDNSLAKGDALFVELSPKPPLLEVLGCGFLSRLLRDFFVIVCHLIALMVST